MTDPENTTAEMLLGPPTSAAPTACATSTPAICRAGSATSKTRAARSCRETLVARYGYYIRDYRITPDGRCPACATPVPGRWSPRFDGQITSRPFIPGTNQIQSVEQPTAYRREI